jgi:hypothetical protein
MPRHPATQNAPFEDECGSRGEGERNRIAIRLLTCVNVVNSTTVWT